MVNISFLLVLVSLVSYGASCQHAPKAPRAPTVTQVTDRVLHGEGPHWDAQQQVLYFVDINGRLINRYDPAKNSTTSITTGMDVGFVIPVANRPGVLLAGVGHDLVNVYWSGEGVGGVANTSVIASVDHKPDQADNRFNDAKADASGRLWAGTMGGEPNGVVNPKQGSLYSLDTNSNTPVMELTYLDVSNGLIWNADNTVMYFIDSPTRKIDAFDFFMSSGDISGRRSVFSLDEFNLPGVPDGMTIDSNGHLWVALFNGWKIIKIDPVTNKLLQEVPIPAMKTTSLTFGGPNLDILYVTTSRRDLTPEEQAAQPGAGAVFAVRGLGVTGVPGGNNKVVRN